MCRMHGWRTIRLRPRTETLTGFGERDTWEELPGEWAGQISTIPMWAEPSEATGAGLRAELWASIAAEIWSWPGWLAGFLPPTMVRPPGRGPLWEPENPETALPTERKRTAISAIFLPMTGRRRKRWWAVPLTGIIPLQEMPTLDIGRTMKESTGLWPAGQRRNVGIGISMRS